jgi:predicted dehydrogenase
VRILIAGLGAIGQRHARNLRAVYGSDLDLIAYRQRRLRHVVTESLQRDEARDVEQVLGLIVFDDLDRALAQKPDAVFVCTPSSQHLSIAQCAVDAGCHLFIEKPLSHNVDGIERLRATVAARGLVALVGCQWRYHPCVRRLRDVLESRALGPLRRADIEYAEYLPDWHPYEDYRTSYAARADLGGGVVLTQIHDYDLAWWLFGPFRNVTASGGHGSALEIDVEDTVHARLEGGVAPVCVRQTFAERPPRRTIALAGEHGSVKVDLVAARLESDTPAVPSIEFTDYERNDMFIAEVRHFADCVAGVARPAVPLDDGIAVLRVALAVKDAMRTGRQVELS